MTYLQAGIAGLVAVGWLSSEVITLGIASKSGVEARVVRVLLAPGCGCAAGSTPTVGPGGESDCVEADELASTPAVDGVCDEDGCEDPRSCRMKALDVRWRLSADDGCDCDAADVVGTGVDSLVTLRTITWNSGWSAVATVGGHYLPCSSDLSAVAFGSVQVTCTSDVGGGIVPRSLTTVNIAYDCTACTGSGG